jgi:hypothetical protein
MILAKAVFGGIVAVVVMWTVVVFVFTGRVRTATERQGLSGLGAVAGGWTYLLHQPSVILLLTIAFGIGLWLTARVSK